MIHKSTKLYECGELKSTHSMANGKYRGLNHAHVETFKSSQSIVPSKLTKHGEFLLCAQDNEPEKIQDDLESEQHIANSIAVLRFFLSHKIKKT